MFFLLSEIIFTLFCNLIGYANIALHCTALHCTAPHRTAPQRTAPHRTAPHRTAPHRTAPHRTAPHRTALHCTALSGPYEPVRTAREYLLMSFAVFFIVCRHFNVFKKCSL
jgi:hypothetical protein